MVSAVLRGTTAARESAVACCTSRRLPKWEMRRWRVWRPTPGMFKQLRIAVAHGAALAMVADGEAMAFVADELDEMQNGRAAVENDRLVFVSVEINDFFFLGDGSQGLRGEAERLQRVGRGVKLAEAAVDEDERRHGLFFAFCSQGLKPLGFLWISRLNGLKLVPLLSQSLRVKCATLILGPHNCDYRSPFLKAIGP